MDAELFADCVVLPTYYVQHIIVQAKNMARAKEHAIQAIPAIQAIDFEQERVSFSTEAFYEFVSSLRQLTDESLGLVVGRRLLANDHGSLGAVAMSCGSIRQFVEVFADFLPLRTDLVRIHSCAADGRLQMELHLTQPLGDIEQVVLEAIMVAIKNVLDYVAIGGERMVEVAFAFAEGKNAALAQHVFACTVRYAQTWTGFSFPLAEVDEPLLIADKTAFEQASDLCRRELEQLEADLPMHKKIEFVMHEQANTLLTFSQVASILELPERTLHRLLEKEGVRFNAILDRVKYRRALEYLDEGLTMKEAGFLLGYQHAPNFSRAFKRWKNSIHDM